MQSASKRNDADGPGVTGNEATFGAEGLGKSPPTPWLGPGGGDERLEVLEPWLRRDEADWPLIATHIPGHDFVACRTRWETLRRQRARAAEGAALHRASRRGRDPKRAHPWITWKEMVESYVKRQESRMYSRILPVASRSSMMCRKRAPRAPGGGVATPPKAKRRRQGPVVKSITTIPATAAASAHTASGSCDLAPIANEPNTTGIACHPPPLVCLAACLAPPEAEKAREGFD